MHSHCEKVISIDDDYLYALFGVFLSWSITIRCKMSYLCHCLILRRMQIGCEKKTVLMVLSFMLCLGYSMHGVAH